MTPAPVTVVKKLEECPKELIQALIDEKDECFILVFVTESCRRTQFLLPTMEEAAKCEDVYKYYLFTHPNFDESFISLPLVKKYKVGGVPTIMKFHGNTLLKIYQGDYSVQSLVEFIKK